MPKPDPSTPAPALNGRRILVTAGPTWIPVDAVRYLGNRSSGRTGLTLARELARHGAVVTLLWGPGRVTPTPADLETITFREFVTFDDLHGLVRETVGSREFDAMIHAAAVADYRIATPTEEPKISSGQEELVLRLVPTPKIVDEIRSLDPRILLVKFKLEVGRTVEDLLTIAAASRERSHADLVVANDLRLIQGDHHPAWLLDPTGIIASVTSEGELATLLATQLATRLTSRARGTHL